MTWACDQRLAYMKAEIDAGRPVNRADVVAKFYVTKTTVAADWHRFDERWPGVAIYDSHQKAYVRADLAADGRIEWKARCAAAEARATRLEAALRQNQLFSKPDEDPVEYQKALAAAHFENAESLRADRLEALLAEAEDLIEQFGTGVTDMFEQMVRGNWTDDHGHNVRLNAQMFALKPIIADAIVHRAKINAEKGEG